MFFLRASTLGSKPELPEPDRCLDLARSASSGCLRSSQLLLQELAPTVARVVAAVLGSKNEELEDVIQQALIAVLHALPGFRGQCHPTGFASSIAFRVALKSRKHQKLDQSRRERLARLALTEPDSLDLQDPCQRRRLLQELLLSIPEEQAEALVLRVVLGLSLTEVAQATGAPINTVRSRVRLAKEALRRRIESVPALREALEAKP